MSITPYAAIIRRAGVCTAILTCYAGCIQYTARPLNPAAHAAALESRALSGSLSLATLQDRAIRSHPDVILARTQYETARAAIRTAGESPNPSIVLTPTVVTPLKSWMAGTYGVDFDWTIETAGKRARRRDVAAAQVRVAAARVVDACWKARAAVRKALLERYTAEQSLAALNEAIASQEELTVLIEQRITEGEESRTALSQPRLLRAQLRLQAADSARTAALARAALAEALGMGVSGLNRARFSYAAFDSIPKVPGSYRRNALTHRADVVAALAEYAAADAALRLEIARQYPDLHFNPGYQLDAGENKWTLGVGLTLPILNQNKGAIGEAEAKRREAAARFDSVQAKALAECDRAYSAFKAARAKLAAADDLLKVQEAQIATEQKLIAEGAGDRSALLSAKVERDTTRAARVNAWAELQAAVGALEEATQTPFAK